MNILITGADGMLGRTLQKRLQGHTLHTPAYPDFDITKADAVTNVVSATRPDLVIHCAAMTQVDACETAQDMAFAVNADGSRNVAQACQAAGTRLIGISTDYVFDGRSKTPYTENDPTNPQTVYGKSKLAGEQAIQEVCDDWAILRIAWLYGAGGPSFLHTMLTLGSQPGTPLKVVDDQVGNPTSCDAVAGVILEMMDHPVTGVFHSTCEGETSWFGFAKEIFYQRGFTREILPCTTADFPRPAPRPANSRLENRALRERGFSLLPDWKEALADFLKQPDVTQ